MSTPLLAGEREIIVSRQHWSIVAPAVAAAVLVTLAGVVLLALIPTTLSGHGTSDIRNAGIAAVLALGGLVIIVRVLQWRAARYLLTDRRIIVARGVLSRFTESIALDRVQNTTVRQSILARMIGFGDIEIESAGRDGAELFHRIPRPQEFENALMTAIEAHRGVVGTPPAGV